MIIWNPPDRLASLVEMLASCRQRYRCLVDGQDEYLGEPLPSGTQAEVLEWIEARYEALRWYLMSPEMSEIVPTTKRYLVQVDGVEKMFVLEPIHEDLLGWHPERALAWNGEC